MLISLFLRINMGRSFESACKMLIKYLKYSPYLSYLACFDAFVFIKIVVKLRDNTVLNLLT